jgi:hypothetical protein
VQDALARATTRATADEREREEEEDEDVLTMGLLG